MKKKIVGEREFSAAYYQELHENNQAFAENNWLVSEQPHLLQFKANSVLELGCGNGRFLEGAAGEFKFVCGVDWAESPRIKSILARFANVRFYKGDVLSFVPELKFDLVVSADFLEHLPHDKLFEIISRMHEWGGVNFHKIACYDDGHSHLSIFPPNYWLELFRKIDASYHISSQTLRKGKKDKDVIVITNG